MHEMTAGGGGNRGWGWRIRGALQEGAALNDAAFWVNETPRSPGQEMWFLSYIYTQTTEKTVFAPGESQSVKNNAAVPNRASVIIPEFTDFLLGAPGGNSSPARRSSRINGAGTQKLSFLRSFSTQKRCPKASARLKQQPALPTASISC